MAAKTPRRQGPNSLHTSARLMINPKPLPCPVNPPLLNSSRFWRRDKLLVSRNTCSPKSSESAERKRAPHVCALNDVQESEHAPCKICKCPHLVGCDCPCLHFQQVQRAISDASRHTGKPPVPPRLDHLSVHIQQTCKGVTICKPPSASPLVKCKSRFSSNRFASNRHVLLSVRGRLHTAMASTSALCLH